MWSLESREDPSPLTQVSNKPDESRPYLFLSAKKKEKKKKKKKKKKEIIVELTKLITLEYEKFELF